VEIVNPEVTAWLRAADVAGVALPDEVQEARQRLEKVDAELAALPGPEAPTPAARLVAGGMGLEEATAENERQAAEALAHKEAHRVVRDAQGHARRNLNNAVAQARDTLIVEAARPVVTALIEEARPHAETLARFAPKFDPGAIVRRGEPRHMKAFQAGEELERRFGAIMAAWRASYKATTTMYGGPKSPARVYGFDPRSVDQVHRYWDAPELVGNPLLNGTQRNRRGYPVRIEPTVLGVASEPAGAGFRLATVRELYELSKSQAKRARAETPWVERRAEAL
jgi:hypothetical protein